MKNKEKKVWTPEMSEQRKQKIAENREKYRLRREGWEVKRKYSEFLDRPEWSQAMDKDRKHIIPFLKEAIDMEATSYQTEFSYLEGICKKHDFNNHDFWLQSDVKLLKADVDLKLKKLYYEHWRRHAIAVEVMSRVWAIRKVYNLMDRTPLLRYDFTEYSRLN